MKISDIVKVDIGEFRIMKSGIKYEEIKDLSHTIYEEGLHRQSRIFVELGKPTVSGEVTVNIYEATFNQIDDNELIQYSDLLFDISVSKDASVREFKALIAKKYCEYKSKIGPEIEIHRDMIRVRDKGVERCGKIMRDGKFIKDYSLCQNKAYAIQVLNYEEQITDDNDLMLVIREWLPGEKGGTLTEKKEILLNRKNNYHEINDALKNNGFIPENEQPENYDI